MDNDEETKMVGQVFLWLLAAAVIILVLAGCTSQQERQAHRDGQVKMIETQVQARTQQSIADATARTALYEAMARVAQTSPDSADAIAVALAVSSVRDEEDSEQGPLVQLQRQENEAVELAKAIAPALITTAGTIGVAAIQADVNKTQSDNAARVAIADSATDADIMRSVTGMASIGLAKATTQVSGDYYVAETLDQSSTQTVTETNTVTDASTSTTTNTETNTSTTTSDSYNTTSGDSTSTYDSYNTTSTSTSTTSGDTNTDSFNTTSTETNTSTENSNNTTTTTETSSETNTEGSYNTSDSYNDNSDNSGDADSSSSYQSADGSYLTREDIINLLQSGVSVRVLIGGEEVEVEQGTCPDGSTGLTFGGGSLVCG